jgi:hypothetical protein
MIEKSEARRVIYDDLLITSLVLNPILDEVEYGALVE